ncbi:MAG: hypothetical protein ACLQJF_26470 [Candidatus Sulfotelmatobacter sp.]
MPRSEDAQGIRKANLEKVKASLGVVRTKCGYATPRGDGKIGDAIGIRSADFLDSEL